MARRVAPTRFTAPTPRTFSSRFLSTCSDQVVSSTAERGRPSPPAGTTATDQIARLAGSKRSTRGSSTSSRNRGRRMPMRSRTSSAALRPSTVSWNSMITTELPS